MFTKNLYHKHGGQILEVNSIWNDNNAVYIGARVLWEGKSEPLYTSIAPIFLCCEDDKSEYDTVLNAVDKYMALYGAYNAKWQWKRNETTPKQHSVTFNELS